MKQRRRTLKNRGYAASCRTKRFQKKGELEVQKSEELKQISSLNEEISQYRSLISQLKGKISECLTFAQNHHISPFGYSHTMDDQSQVQIDGNFH
jgi:uncharacterized protein (DUF3084 family)